MKKVLLVDDSTADLKLLASAVEGMEGYEVAGSAKDGLEAIKLYASLKPDVVLLDLAMPGMDGLRALRHIVGLDENASVVVISPAGGGEEEASEALGAGAKGVIPKPLDQEKVAGLLKSI